MSYQRHPDRDERTGRMPRILAIDDEGYLRGLFRIALEDEGLEVRVAANGAEALVAIQDWPADVVICDIYMPEMDGIEAIPALLDRMPGCKILAITGAVAPLPNLLSTAVMLGAVRTLEKPFSTGALVDAVKSMLANDC